MFLVYLFEKWGFVMGIVGIVIGLVFVIGLIFFGWIIDNYFWWVFFLFILLINILVIIVLFFILWKVLLIFK